MYQYTRIPTLLYTHFDFSITTYKVSYFLALIIILISIIGWKGKVNINNVCATIIRMPNKNHIIQYDA